MNVFTKKENAKNLWNINGNFGELNGAVTKNENNFYIETEKLLVITELEKHENGVCIRKGKIKNISNEDVCLRTISSKFSLDGGEYEVYTQYNGWQNESMGDWQKLVTSVYAHSNSVRNAHSAAPFMVLWSNQQGRGTAFHLIAYSSWEMKITRVFSGNESTFIEVELGVLKDGLNVKLAPMEEIEIPPIIYYEVLNRTDMDCWKLHGYLNKKYPRKTMPVIYNTWLYKYDRFNFDDISNQIEKAQEIGAEYFVIDAGWFGNGEEWWPSRGDWEENLTFGFKGKMCEISDKVREHGMKFGFWLEPECASARSEIVKKHPDYFIKGEETCFLDFDNPKALNFIFEKTCELIDRYNAEFVKFDFNADLDFDKSGNAFIGYFKGQVQYIKKLKEKYPGLYIENCASGGMRMTLRDGLLYDSFWLSDNQSPYHGLRIFKETMLRLPPQWIECWAVLYSVEKMCPISGANGFADKLIACNDATWSDVAGVEESFLKGFLTGSPIGLSFDLNSLTENHFEELKSFIHNFKLNRDFWQKAVCHILIDTESLLVLEFRNDDFSRVEIVVFSNKIMQDNVCIHPVLSEKYDYKFDEKILNREEIFKEGIDVSLDKCYTAKFLSLMSL